MGRMKDFSMSIETALIDHPEWSDREVTIYVLDDCGIETGSYNYVYNNVQRHRAQREEEIKP